MIWSKLKQHLEGFLCPALQGRVEYRASSYRYMPDKPGQCYITVDKIEVFKMNGSNAGIRWYRTEQEIKNDPGFQIPVSNEEIEKVREDTFGKVPEDRLAVIARDRKITDCAKEIMAAQAVLSKSDFGSSAGRYLSASLEECLESKDILTNVFALIDKRLGKKRLNNLEEKMKLKHPIVQYFYWLRRSTI
ncbi:MAG: hypothetical protein AB9844_09785 [Clostridiaceae bacterium]